MTILELKNITKTYNNIEVVKKLNLKVEKGKFLTFLGPSGCGKTTTLRMIAGLEMPTTGLIEINGRRVFDSEKRICVPPENRNIGMVFQSYAVWPHMNVFDNIAYPLKVKRFPKKEVEQRVKSILKTVGLDGYEKRFPRQLSGGQQQRVALARALVMEPDILLLDEPLSNLDAKLRKKMSFEIKELQRKTKITVIYVTHDQLEALSMSDEIAIMNNGTVHQVGTPEEIYHFPIDTFVAKFIGISNFFDVEQIKIKGSLAEVTFLKGKAALTVQLREEFNSKCKLAIKPVDIKLSKDKGSIMAKIVKRVFLGDKVEYLVIIEDGSFLTVVDYSFSFKEGDIVYLEFLKGVLVKDYEDSTYQ